MRYGILSDIHSNLSALETVLRRLEREKIDRYICLGDTVGYGASPNECCELVRSLEPVIVQGNHDCAAVNPGEERWFTPPASACIVWTRENLTDDNLRFLAELSPFASVEGAQLCHGSLFDRDYYTTTPRDALMSFAHMTTDLALFGHTHYAEWYTEHTQDELPTRHPMNEGGELPLAPDRRYLLNPGAVGQPRDGNSQAGYAIWDSDANTIQLLRAPYNIRQTQEMMRAADLPWNMSERLMLGV